MKAILENSCRKRIEAFKKMDPVLFSSAFAQQGRLMLTGGYVMEGREVIQEKMGAFMHLVGPMDVSIEIQNYWEIDHVIYEQGKYEYVSVDNGKLFNRGSYIIHWEKQSDGAYRILHDFEIDMI